MQAGKRAIGRTHVIVLALIIAAVVLWLLLARPKLVGQGPAGNRGRLPRASTTVPDSRAAAIDR
jgi:hypothetical protein